MVWKLKIKQQLNQHSDSLLKPLLMGQEATTKMDSLLMEIVIILRIMEEKINKMKMIKTEPTLLKVQRK